MTTWTKVEPETEKEQTPAWKPEKEGDTIEGVLMEKKTGVGQHKSNLYTFFLDGDDVADTEVVVWGGAVLDSRLKNVEIETKVKIEYLGEKEGKNGKYKDYDVFTEEA